jgi:hypothetical protein
MGREELRAVGAPTHRSSGSGASGRCVVGRRRGVGATGSAMQWGMYLTCVAPMGRCPTPHRPSSRSTAPAFPSSYRRRSSVTARLQPKIHVEQQLGRVPTPLNRFEPVAVQQRIFFFTELNVSSVYTLLFPPFPCDVLFLFVICFLIKCLVRTLLN